MSAGQQVGFFEWLRNDEPSNISQLFVRETNGVSVVGAQWHIEDSAGNPVSGRAGACGTTTPLSCSFGALNSGQTVYLIAAFNVPTTATVELAMAFEWYSTGTPPGNNQSNGDIVPQLDRVAIGGSNDGDAAGDFNFGEPGPFIVTTLPVSSTNRQATSVTVTRTVTGIAVGDSPSLTLPCADGVPAKFKCSSLTSLTSSIEVGNGATITDLVGRPRIKVVVSFAKLPSQLKGSNRFAYHWFVDATGAGQVELITATCTYDALNLPTNTSPCLTVGNNQVTVWVTHNGGMRF